VSSIRGKKKETLLGGGGGGKEAKVASPSCKAASEERGVFYLVEIEEGKESSIAVEKKGKHKDHAP